MMATRLSRNSGILAFGPAGTAVMVSMAAVVAAVLGNSLTWFGAGAVAGYALCGST
jgi:hypothetical protein